jgi:hypothetical protein
MLASHRMSARGNFSFPSAKFPIQVEKKKERNELQFDILLMLLHYFHLNQKINQRPTNPLVFSKRKVNLYVHRKTNQLLCLDRNFSNIFLYPQHGK